MYHSKSLPALTALCILAGSAAIDAQTQARIAGKVVDQAGNPLVDVVVAAVDLATSAAYDGTTNKKGRFTVGVVNGANPHQVTISKESYQTLSNEITPGAGATFQQVFTLYPEGGAREATAGGAQQLEGGGAAVRLYNRGADLYNEGDKLAAQEKLLKALTEDPGLVEAHKVLSSIALDRGDAEEALEHADAFLVTNPNDGVGLTLKFDALISAGRPAEAAGLVTALAAARPDAETMARAFNAASSLYLADDYDAAGSLLATVLEIEPQHPRSLLLLSDIRLGQERYGDALELTQRLLSAEPDNVRALTILHRASVKSGDQESAHAAFERLAEADPVSVAATFAEEGARLFGAGQTQAAIEVLEQSLGLDPDNITANYNLGVAYVGENRGSEAKALLAHFLELAPEHAEAESARAMLGYLE